MIRLVDKSVVIDLEEVAAIDLDDYAVEILAHEIGHHVLAPASATDSFRLIARLRAALPTLERHAPMVANLYTDLLINDRLQRQAGLRMADVYARMHDRLRTAGPSRSLAAGSACPSPSGGPMGAAGCGRSTWASTNRCGAWRRDRSAARVAMPRRKATRGWAHA